MDEPKPIDEFLPSDDDDDVCWEVMEGPPMNGIGESDADKT